MTFLYGAIFGVMLSLFFSFGPAFFSLLQTSVHYGFRRSVPFAYGVGISDIIVVFLLLTVLEDVNMSDLMQNAYVVIISAAVIFTFGIYTFMQRAEKSAEEKGAVIKFKSADNPKWYFVAMRGVLINTVNPLIWIFWISVISIVSGALGLSTTDPQMLVFFAGALLVSLGLDVLKCRLASLLQHVLTANVINVINKIAGLMLVVFAAYLVAAMVMNRNRVPEEKESGSKVLLQKIINVADSSRVHPAAAPDTVVFVPEEQAE